MNTIVKLDNGLTMKQSELPAYLDKVRTEHGPGVEISDAQYDLEAEIIGRIEGTIDD